MDEYVLYIKIKVQASSWECAELTAKDYVEELKSMNIDNTVKVVEVKR